MSNKNKILLLFICSLLSSNFQSIAQVANIGVDGWATYTTGGRGGRIIRVTNLNESGPGSFAEAIAATGSRIIVFEVGGVINLNGSSKTIKNPYITIAGQTAPGNGITLINGGLSINTHDVILRHIRIRPGASGHEVGSWEPDGVTTYGASNIIIDHCSFSWAVDENCSASGPRFNGVTPEEWRNNTSHSVTISNNIIAEGLSNSTHSEGEHSKGSLIHDNVTDVAVLNNLYASNRDRNPLFKGGARGVIANNYIYNPGSAAISYILVDDEWTGHEQQTGMISVVGNYLQPGPSSSSSIVLFKMGNGPCEVYMNDNISNKSTGIVQNEYKGDLLKIASEKPIWNSNIHPIPCTDVLQNIIHTAGARPWNRDETDTRLLNEILTNTGKIINYETEVGGYPNYTPTNKLFIEEEWNLDYMLKLSPYISIITPDNETEVAKDSDFTVESIINGNSDSVNYLELFINGVSYGKISQAPYKWNVNIDKTGSYELLVVADVDNEMKTASKTFHINVTDTVSSINKTDKNNNVSCIFSPNPFNRETEITYNLNQATFVRLTIYNSMGSQIETLVSEYQIPGEHKILWSPTGLSAGIYFSRMSYGDKFICDKLIYK